MIIYNVTVNVDDEIREEWVKWMLNIHIPDIFETGLFVDFRFTKVLVEEESGTTYATQYELNDLESFRLYEELYAPKLRAETQSKFGNKIVAFRTLLELISQKSKV